jgi:hypothetical protein
VKSILAELNVLFDLVVEAAHILARTSQPVLAETFRTVGVVPQESVSETPKRMLPSFMRSGVHVDILQFLQRRVKMATDDVRRRDGSSCPSAEQKARLSLADELFEEGRNRRVDINLTKAVRCFESLFDPAVMNFLLDENGQAIWRDVLVDLDAKRLPYSQTAPAADN